MLNRIAQPSREVSAGALNAGYGSQILKLFVEGIERASDAQVLDVGPICGVNIDFFARRAKRLFLCDMFLRFARCLRREISFSQALKNLDYPLQTFDGILLWHLLDHLDEPDAKRLVDLCHTMMRPGGRVMLFALSEKNASSYGNAYVIGGNFHLYTRSYRLQNLPLHYRQNRDIMTLLVPLRPVKSFIYRDGLREFLFEKK